MCINAQVPVQELYGVLSLEALVMMERKLEPFRHSHEKWETDFNEYKNTLIEKLSQAIFDYTAVVVAGEMRHSMRIVEKAFAEFAVYIPRGTLYHECYKWNPYDILKAGELCFDWDWSDSTGYGGHLWKNIASAGLKYKKVPDIVFIDHCVDLSHNNSIYFDKSETGIFTIDSSSGYKQMLDFKRYRTPEEYLRNWTKSRKLFQFIQRAINLGLIETCLTDDRLFDEADEESLEELFDYNPIVWKNEQFNWNIFEKEDEEDEDEEEEEYYEEDDDEEYGNQNSQKYGRLNISVGY